MIHAYWDFDSSNAQMQRVSELDKHQNETKVHYFVTIPERKVNMQFST